MDDGPENLTFRLLDDDDAGAIDPFELFEEWFAEARASEANDPNAMTLATVDHDGAPDARIVLLNGRDRQGFLFFTNLESEKGKQLLADGRGALVFHWKSLRRQVRIRGIVERVSDREADAYFATRPRPSRLGAHASQQSRPLQSRQVLIDRVARLDADFGDKDVPRPAHWSGFRLRPSTFEFWKDGAFRLHDRFRFERGDETGAWRRQRLNP